MTETIDQALERCSGDPAWLCDQLERWPVRVHQERTTSITYLNETASAIITAASVSDDLPPPLDRPMVERMTAALATFRRRNRGL